MWYAAKPTRPDITQESKKLRDARQTLKWLPALAVIALFAAVLGVVRYVQHPDIEHSLNFIFPVGITLQISGYWKTAHATLKGASNALGGILSLLGIMLTASGPALSNMWHHKEMIWFDTLGTAVAALTAWCLVCIVWEWDCNKKAKRQSGDSSR